MQERTVYRKSREEERERKERTMMPPLMGLVAKRKYSTDQGEKGIARNGIEIQEGSEQDDKMSCKV